MTIQPLDRLGNALRAEREHGRHEIDWTGHPLMAVYLAHSHVRTVHGQAVKRGMQQKQERGCSAFLPPA